MVGSAQAWCLQRWGRSRDTWLRSETSVSSSACEPLAHPAVARVWHQQWGCPSHQQTSARSHQAAASAPSRWLTSTGQQLLAALGAVRGPMEPPRACTALLRGLNDTCTDLESWLLGGLWIFYCPGQKGGVGCSESAGHVWLHFCVFARFP